jgi:hypothetical protein
MQCPWWCFSNHNGPLTDDEEQRYQIRAHAGRERSLPNVADELGERNSAAVALVQVDNLATGERGPVGVSAYCEGVMTPEQAGTFASLVLHAMNEARVANLNGGVLVPSPDDMRGTAQTAPDHTAPTKG